MNRIKTIAMLAVAGLTAAASADITGAYTIDYSVSAADFDGGMVTVNVKGRASKTTRPPVAVQIGGQTPVRNTRPPAGQ